MIECLSLSGRLILSLSLSEAQVSEGIDFSNDKGRAVVITGLPFPPTKDAKIVLKKSILDEAVVPPGELVRRQPICGV